MADQDFEMLYDRSHVQNLEQQIMKLQKIAQDLGNENSQLKRQLQSQQSVQIPQNENQLNQKIQDQQIEITRILQEKNQAQTKYENLVLLQKYNQQQQNNNNEIEFEDLKKSMQILKKDKESQNMELLHLAQKQKNLENELKTKEMVQEQSQQFHQSTMKELQGYKTSNQQYLQQMDEKDQKIEQLTQEIQNYEFLIDEIEFPTFMQKQKIKIQKEIQANNKQNNKAFIKSIWIKLAQEQLAYLKQLIETQGITYALPQVQEKQ